MSIECQYSFDDLYLAAFQSELSDAERAGFKTLLQSELNRLVADWAAKAGWHTAERVGSDGKIYLAFWPDLSKR